MYGEYEECLQCGHFVDVVKKVTDKFPNFLTQDRKPGRKKKVA
jgi:predicted nucleic acid-binding Zn ribbon protein